jgi:hypothetical protein
LSAVIVPTFEYGLEVWANVPILVLLAGIAVSTAQAAILRGYIRDGRFWFLATCAGPALLVFVAMDFPYEVRGTDWFIAATIGWGLIWIINSMAQAAVLHHFGCRGSAWFITSCAAGAIGFTVGAWLGITIGVMNQVDGYYYPSSGNLFVLTGYHLAVLPQTWIVGSTVASTIAGGFNGIALLRLLAERTEPSDTPREVSLRSE